MTTNLPTDPNSHETDQAIVPVNALASMMRAEIDTQIATAKAYPRSITRFKQQAASMVTIDEDTAAGCFYSLPRGGRTITGPSVRLAEIVGSAWGNIRYGARVVADDGRMLTAQGICLDLEKNVSATVEISRRITDKKGRRYSDDMIAVTANAACSIALRNVIFKIIPRVYVDDIMRQAKETAIGNVKSLATKRTEMVNYFGKMGVAPERVFLAVGKTALDDVGLEELATLKGLATALRDGDTTPEEAFPAPPPAAVPGAKTRTEQVAEGLGAKTQNGHTATEPSSTPQAPSAHAPSEDEEEMDREDLHRRLAEAIEDATGALFLEQVGRELIAARDLLGERRYQMLTTEYGRKREELERAEKAKVKR